MAYPVSVKKNNYHKNKKNNIVYTPAEVSRFIFNLIKDRNYKTILDPAYGEGDLIKPWYDNGCKIIGVEPNKDVLSQNKLDATVINEEFQKITEWEWDKPDLIICNPPFNHKKNKIHMYKSTLIPEIFFWHLTELFGFDMPLVLFTPFGFRLNQDVDSRRWRRLTETRVKIASILSLPRNVFDGVQFHSEVLFFNITGLEPHYFLENLIKP